MTQEASQQQAKKTLCELIIEIQTNLILTKDDIQKEIAHNQIDVNGRDANGWTALTFNAFCGNTTAVDILLTKLGADVNAKDGLGKTPLMHATQNGKLEVVALLLTHGADVNAKDRGGCTTLMNVAFMGHQKVAELLLERGADVNAKNSGVDASMIAAQMGHTEIVQLLLQHNAKNSGALMIAAQMGHTEIVKLLLGHQNIAKGSNGDAVIQTDVADELASTMGESDAHATQDC